MPIYEYDCPKCGRFEEAQRITDPPRKKHACGSKVTRLISATSFSLKGSGWYATDYAGKAKSGADKPAANEKIADASSDKTPDKNSDKTPDKSSGKNPDKSSDKKSEKKSEKKADKKTEVRSESKSAA